MTAGEELERSEVEAVLETRRELGLRYDAELVDGFADRIEAEVARRVGAEVQAQQQAQRAQASAGPRQLALAIVSMVPVGIPITAINLAAGDQPSILGLTISWCGIVGVNVAHAWQSRRRWPRSARTQRKEKRMIKILIIVVIVLVVLAVLGKLRSR